MNLPILQADVTFDEDLVLVRRRAQQIAALAGLSDRDQVRFVTALSEIARNALQHAGGGKVEFRFLDQDHAQMVQAIVRDRGRGIAGAEAILNGPERGSTGISSAKKLVECFQLDTELESGTVVTLGKVLPKDAARVTPQTVADWADSLTRERPQSAFEEVYRQKQELIDALEEIRRKEADLQRQLGEIRRLNEELDQTNTALKQSEQKIQTILSSAGEGIVELSPEGAVTYINPGAMSMTGFERQELLGQPFASVLTQESGPQFVEEMQKHAEVDRWSCELMMRRKNGDPFWVRVSANTIRDADWKPLGLVLVTTDIMHLKELDRMKTEFVSMVSHELRTPLTSIKGYVSMLREGELGEMTPEQHEFLDITLENADRLMGLINDLLDISRIESGRLSLALSEFEFGDVIKAVRSDMRAMGETKQIKTVVEGDAKPVRVRADRDRVVQILANLLSNAYKYSPEGTTVRIRTHVDQRFARIQVVDQGMGLSEQDLAKLFTKFFRTEAAKQRGISGTGLGLSISRQLVEMQGGEMSVKSEIGHGSTFAFTLPLVETTHSS